MLVGVIGPPGAGKSTVVAELAAGGGVPVFRLGVVVRRRPELLSGLPPSGDPLGWVSPEAVRKVLHATFLEDGFAAGSSTVLLDHFPGTAGQLELLADIATATGEQMALLELHADGHAAARRVARRRVCLACGPDPHVPAAAAVDDPERCGRCRTALARRDTDTPGIHALRLARYAANRPAISAKAAARGIPHLTVNADTTMSEVCQAAHTALHRLTESAEPNRSRP